MTRTRLLIIGILGSAALSAHAAPKSLYERIGGIHKIAAAVDMCVEMEWKDPVISKNERFRQAMMVGKPFVKFTITNTLSAAAGGPQKTIYSVVPISKWMNLTKAQSDRAWSIREMCFKKVGVPRATFVELKSWFMKAERMAKPMAPEMETFRDSGSLYARLGGIMPISAVVDDFVNQLSMDKTIGSNKNVVKALSSGKTSPGGLKYFLTEQIAAAAGGPYTYSGRSMASSHKGMNVTAAQWDAGAMIFKRVLEKHKVPQKEQDELLAAVAATRGDIVNR